MFKPIFFILCLTTGEQTFSISKLSFALESDCKTIVSQLQANYGPEFVVKGGCAYFPPEQGI